MYCSDTTFLILSQYYLFTTETSVYQILKTDKPVHKAFQKKKLSNVICILKSEALNTWALSFLITKDVIPIFSKGKTHFNQKNWLSTLNNRYGYFK